MREFNGWMRVMEGKGLEGEEGTLLSLTFTAASCWLSLSLIKLWVSLACMQYQSVYTSLVPISSNHMMPCKSWEVMGTYFGHL